MHESVAKQSILSLRGDMGCVASLAMTATERPRTMLSSSAKAGDPVRRGSSVLTSASLEYWVARSSRAMTPNMTSHSRGALRPRFAGNFPPSPNRGRRECRMRAAPAISCANCAEKAAHEHTGQRRTSDIPCAMALRLITRSPRRTALLPPLRPEKQLLPGALTPAPRRQDHASLPYARAALVNRNCGVHRSPPNGRDDGRRPSEQDGMGIDMPLFGLRGKRNIFCIGADRISDNQQ